MLRDLIVIVCYFTLSFSPLVTGIANAQQQTQSDEQEKPAPKEEQQEKSPDNKSSSQQNSQSINRIDIKITTPTDSLELKKSDLSHYLTEDKITPILVGPNDYSTLIETNSTENTKGVMILLPEWQQSAVTPKALNFLRQELPQQGWTTITVQPPKKPLNYPSTALTLEERIKENDKTLLDHQNVLKDIMTTVTDKAKTYPGIIVVIAEGHHASLLAKIYQQAEKDKPTALVMLSGYLNNDTENMEAAKKLAMTDLPILDLFLTRDHRIVEASAKERKKFVNQELKAEYRQKQLHNFHTSYYPNEILLKEIIGWLKSLGW